MHRFRRKSDAKRSQVPEHLRVVDTPQSDPQDPPADTFPSLPPASDFRTSLILPSLSRRFTLLRDSNGDFVSIDDVRSKLAEQRARGAEHQITEEEEDMVVHALSEIRATNPLSQSRTSLSSTAYTPAGGDSIFASQQDVRPSDYATSIRSGMASSVPSSPYASSTNPKTPSRYSNKRNSNNLFGSNRFHDTSYLHSINKSNGGTSRSTIIGSDSQGGSVRSTRSLREGENSLTSSKQDSNGEPTVTQLNRSQEVPSPSFSPASPRTEYTAQQIGRTALALEQVIRGIEEEAEETIMIPRRSVSRAGTSNSRTQSPKPTETSAAGTPIPWMTDEARVDDRDEDERSPTAVTHLAAPSPLSRVTIPTKSPSPSPVPYRSGTTSPTPRIPGYIPGMPRPITPARENDSDRDDGLTGYSTTPRARSPAYPLISNHSNHIPSHSFSSSRHHHQSSVSSDIQNQPILPPSVLRSSRGAGFIPPLRTTSPALGSRSRGNSISGTQVPSPLPSPAPDERFRSDFMLRRPLSPLTGTAVPAGNSRPSTPAAVWSAASSVAQTPSQDESPRPEAPMNGSFNSHTDNSQRSGNVTNFLTNLPWLNSQARNGISDISQDSSVSSIELGHPLHPPHSAASVKIAARVPTPISSRTRSPPVGTDTAPDPILLNRVLSKRIPKRIQTPPPHAPSVVLVPLASQTPTSSNSSSNINLNLYGSPSPNLYGNPSPMFSPILNTSSTSLLSASSGYHSWTEETSRKNNWDQLLEYDARRIDWRAMLDNKSGDTSEIDESDVEEMENPEQILMKKIGLTKEDLVALQARLVQDAMTKRFYAEQVPRSPVRRRRVSESRASLQALRENGTQSPGPPQRQPTPVTDTNPPPPPAPDPLVRAHTLLDSVLNSIQSQSNTSSALSSIESSDAPTAEPQSTTENENASKPSSTASSTWNECRQDDSSASRYKAIVEAIEIEEKAKQQQQQQASKAVDVVPPVPAKEEDSGDATEVPSARQWRSQPPVPPPTNVHLVREVSRKAAEATAALKSTAQTRAREGDGTLRRKPIKRIDLQQISNPHLVSKSTSVNAIPIVPSPAAAALSSSPSVTQLERSSSSKFTDRIKRLRGSLRTKPSSRDGSEVSPFIISPSTLNPSSQRPQSPSTILSPTSPSGQTLLYTQQHYNVPFSATEQARTKVVPVPAPPASAGPSIKGFMSRFRKSRKETSTSAPDKSAKQEPRHEPIQPTLTATSSRVSRPPEGGYSANARPVTPARSPTPGRHSEDFLFMDSHNLPTSPTRDPVAVDQLLNAAEQLGLDTRELNQMLARSTARSSRNDAWAPNVTAQPSLPVSRVGTSMDRSRTPDSSSKAQLRPNQVNRYPEGEVVRRTIIFASDNPSTPDLTGLDRKDSLPASGRPSRSASGTSIHSLRNGEQTLPKVPTPSLPRGHASKSSQSSSFFDTHDQDMTIVPQRQTEGTPPEDMAQGPALEVLQLSNGQVIWSVIDSLRAMEDEEDSQSLFRRSMSSSRGHDGEEVEIRVKEHRRWESKGSNVSQGNASTRRRQPAAARPETQLYKTDPSTIGRLIEDLSRNMESGSFNFQRSPSAATSFHSDTEGPSRQVERELEALLNAINPRRGI